MLKHNGQILALSSPWAKSSLFYRWHHGEAGEAKTYEVKACDLERTKPLDLQQKKLMDHNQYLREMQLSWDIGDGNQFFDPLAVKQLFGRVAA